MAAITVEQAFQLIRTDKHLGRGSNSHVDEAMTDKELRRELQDLKEAWEENFNWSSIKKSFYRIERTLWNQSGLPWPHRP